MRVGGRLHVLRRLTCTAAVQPNTDWRSISASQVHSLAPTPSMPGMAASPSSTALRSSSLAARLRITMVVSTLQVDTSSSG